MSPELTVRGAHVTLVSYWQRTIDIMTTQGRFRLATIANASDVFPEPELPATPIIEASPQGGL
jgi:hypothetical protein